MPKISEAKRQARREQIITATWSCFSRHGIHATSMEQIIREANLSAGAVYLYYKNKEELILAALSSAFQEMRERLAPILSEADTCPLPVFIRETCKIILSHGRRDGLDLSVAFLLGWSEAQSNAAVKKLIATGQLAYLETLTGLVRKWQAKGEVLGKGKPEKIAKAILSYFLGFIVQSAMIGGIDPEIAAEGMKGLISSRSTKRR